MVLSAPIQRTWSVDDVVTAAMLNSNVRDAVNYLVQQLNPLTLNGMEVQSSSSLNVSTATWTINSMTATPTFSGGSGLTGQANGITVANAGRYLVETTVLWAANSTGRRYVGIGQSTLSQPTAFLVSCIPTASSGAVTSSFSKEITCAVNDTISSWAYQDSGTTIAVTSRSLVVRQVA